jgi:hypothetical protein
MSVVKITITENHIKLLKNLQWSVDDNNVIVGIKDEGDEIAPPFGMDSIYEAIDLILNGKPSESEDETEFKTYSKVQKDEWDQLYRELPLALEVILSRGSFETGTFKTKYHLRNWEKI